MTTGHPEAIPGLVAEMQNRIQELTAQMSASSAPESAPDALSEVKIFGDEMSSLPLDRLAHSGDREFWRRLPAQAGLNQMLDEVRASGIMQRSRRSILATGMRLTPNVSKSLFEVVDHCRKILDLKIPLDLFVVQDQQFNAGVLPVTDGKLSIYLTAGLLESFSPIELAFVIGHEMGHALFGHNTFPVESIVRNFGHALSPKDVIGLRAWQRTAELSADRCGLLCAQDYAAACQAFFKLSSGITSPTFQFSVRDYMEQYADLEKYIKESPAEDMEEFYSSHPLNPVRLKALELFSHSHFYHELGATGGTGQLSESEVDEQTRAFMSLMEPTYLNEASALGTSVREFIFYVGYMLAKSDGTIASNELEQLTKILDGNDAVARVQETLQKPDEKIIEQICEHAAKINFEMPAVQRLNILRDVFTIATADGELAESEIEEMSKICGVLGIRASFVEELIRSSASVTPAAA